MFSKIASGFVLFLGLQVVAIAAEKRVVIHAYDVANATLIGTDDVALYFKPEKWSELNHHGIQIGQNIRLEIPHHGLIGATFKYNCICLTFATIPDKLRFLKTVQTGCCQ